MALCDAPGGPKPLRLLFLQRPRLLQHIADMLDGSYPRYARTRARLAERRNRYGRARY
ncbi:protein of unknown function (plasmid) [Cupriavidus taiwanensis]|uniref:Uncharacterized protein n=1 Tax=Cupriavidus taiwanensis TaxID=164546 RepID=A0A375HBF9_9BURK|nr:hypothetical protein CBM2614_U10015 [Cupriavidus taiwanensis]SOZ73296.1 hypothetical protein CBM2615_U10011 [Cupriavidus taiwanensis]SOZ75206.1 hypothetical protein CBM2613_U10108 [Cupriavidus taiwanensis]SPA03687.1 protein of unknown function [Cupriavidus taiwanensis]SPA11587.1 protein of unknown function [Cupriavidus taiwanensis]